MNFLIALLTITLSAQADTRVRRVSVRNDAIATVKTALGIATIIQVPDRPNSVVVGDQNAFKVEYLDRAITIKPLHSSAKSNLYIYTDWKRFNVQLVTGAQTAADYVVYLENERKKIPSVSWTPFQKKLKNENIILEVRRLGAIRGGPLLVEFEVHSKKKEKIQPEWLWLSQKNATKPIHNLFLSSLTVESGTGIQGVLQILRSDLDLDSDFKLELRRKQTAFLTIPKVKTWR